MFQESFCVKLYSCNIKNRLRSFKHPMVVETGLSDFHKMCVTFMKTCYNKQKRFIVKYCKFKNVSNDTSFLEDFDTASYADDTTIYTTGKNKQPLKNLVISLVSDP